MNYKKIITAFAVLTMVLSSVSCGKNDEAIVEEVSSEIITENEKTEDTTEKEEEKDTEKEVTTKKPKDKSKDKEKSTESEEKTTEKNETTTTKKGSSSDNSKPSETKSASGNGSSSSGNTASNGNASSGGNTSSQQNSNTSEKVTEAQETPEESEYTAEIVFNGNPVVNGNKECAYAEGKTAVIRAGGDYRVSGSSADAQIYVETATEEKVKIILDGVDIACSDGPAILINEAKKCNIELADGSANYLRDGGTDKINDGVIFSNDTLRIKGNGSLEINSGNAHGISSDDDVIIESGRYVINSVKSGIFAHDDITVNGGELDVRGGTNGMKSKGTVNINGGFILVTGGNKEEKSSIYASSAFNYTGGEVYAVGNKVTALNSSSTPYIVVSFEGGVSGENATGLYLNGSEMRTLYTDKNFQCIMILSQNIGIGNSFKVNLNGAESKEFSVSDMQNVFVVG